MKKDLEMLRVWVEEQEAGHLPATAAHRRESSRDRDEEEEREASNMIIEPDDNDTDNEVRDVKDTSTRTVEDPAADGEWGEVEMEIDESRRSEEDAAQALVALAEQKTTTQVRQRPPTSLPTEKGRAMSYAQAERFSPEDLPADETALAREAALRKQQDARREQVRIQKEQAHAAAAISILRERQDAAANSKKPSPPLSNADTQSGNVVAKNTILPSAEVKVKTKKSKPVSGGVKLGPENAAKGEVPVSTDPSPALERAAALGLRVRPNSTKSGDCQSAPSSKPKKTRNSSLPPSHCDRESPLLDDVSACRTGSDPGDVPIIQPTKAPEMPPHLSTDVQLMNLRFALQDEGITWEAISRSRPQLPGIKTEEREDDLRTPGISSSAQSIPTPLSLPRLLSANPLFATPTPSATTVTAAPIAAPLKPLPSRKQLPKFNKTMPQTETTNNGQTSKSAAADIAAQPQVLARSNDNTIVSTRPSEVPLLPFHTSGRLLQLHLPPHLDLRACITTRASPTMPR
ncbi:hypothetical protein B0H13DRAFT_664090 [Mycena leptocephala]|nr:hypothetical protein B0H13DRAFT_664090 [Mycena leptocephala]